MLTEDYVGFETAKLLKEKGFEGRMHTFYTDEGKEMESAHVVPSNFFPIYRPTLQMVMKWLREVHHFNISVSGITDSSCDADGNIVDEWQYWSYSIQSSLDFHYIYDDADQLNPNQFQTYEEACEAAIKYCLENLI